MAGGRPEINIERCKGCRLCISTCPEEILKMSDETNMQGFSYPLCIDEGRCSACTFCAVICPDIAIEIYKYG